MLIPFLNFDLQKVFSVERGQSSQFWRNPPLSVPGAPSLRVPLDMGTVWLSFTPLPGMAVKERGCLPAAGRLPPSLIALSCPPSVPLGVSPPRPEGVNRFMCVSFCPLQPPHPPFLLPGLEHRVRPLTGTSASRLRTPLPEDLEATSMWQISSVGALAASHPPAQQPNIPSTMY